MDQQSVLKALQIRVSDLEIQLNFKPKVGDIETQTIKQSIDLFFHQFNDFLSSQPSHAKLFENLKKYNIKPDASTLDLVDLEAKRELLLAKLSDLKTATMLLKKIDVLKDFKTVSDIDLTGVDVTRIQELQLKYNYLLMKSIEVFSNYLRLLEKIKIRYGLLFVSDSVVESEDEQLDSQQGTDMDSTSEDYDQIEGR